MSDEPTFVLDAHLNLIGMEAACGARIAGPFLTSDASYVQCGLSAGHKGDHRSVVEWVGTEQEGRNDG